MYICVHAGGDDASVIMCWSYSARYTQISAHNGNRPNACLRLFVGTGSRRTDVRAVDIIFYVQHLIRYEMILFNN